MHLQEDPKNVPILWRKCSIRGWEKLGNSGLIMRPGVQPCSLRSVGPVSHGSHTTICTCSVHHPPPRPGRTEPQQSCPSRGELLALTLCNWVQLSCVSCHGFGCEAISRKQHCSYGKHTISLGDPHTRSRESGGYRLRTSGTSLLATFSREALGNAPGRPRSPHVAPTGSTASRGRSSPGKMPDSPERTPHTHKQHGKRGGRKKGG